MFHHNDIVGALQWAVRGRCRGTPRTVGLMHTRTPLRAWFVLVALLATSVRLPLVSSSPSQGHFDGLLALDPQDDYGHYASEAYCLLDYPVPPPGPPFQLNDCPTPSWARPFYDEVEGAVNWSDLQRAWVVENLTHFSFFFELARLPPDLPSNTAEQPHCRPEAGGCAVAFYTWQVDRWHLSRENWTKSYGESQWFVGCRFGNCGDSTHGSAFFVEDRFRRHPPNVAEFIFPRYAHTTRNGGEVRADISCAGDVFYNLTYRGDARSPREQFRTLDNATNAQQFNYTVKLDGPGCDRPPSAPRINEPHRPPVRIRGVDALAAGLLAAIVVFALRRRRPR
jgi:hypothetical protein